MCLMFFWNLSRNINDVLIPHLKRACQLTDFQSALVQSAFFGAYFLLAIPAGLYIQKKGYKAGMVTGLLLAAVGATIFYPAAETRYYPLFLTALFVMAAGFTFLEVTATPYISKLGDPEGASSRLSLSAAMGSVGATIAPYIASLLLLHEKDIPDAEIASYSPAKLEIFLHNEAGLVKLPYLSLAILFFLVAIVLVFIKLPTIADEEGKGASTFKDLFKFPHTINGVLGVFCYLGAEVGIVSFLIRYSKSLHLEGLTEQKSALFITVYMLLVLVGRIAGSAILKIFKPNRMLVVSAGGALLLVLSAIFSHGYFSIWSLAIIGLFTSIMYPIIFTLSIRNLGVHTKKASSLLIMGIVGGAIVPPIMGYISDKWGIKNAFFVPVICYAYVIYFAIKGSMAK
ncbi:MAG: L-fucose:H+ symporter permease [Bacteroidetes bacterium]|nr:L-fucose:H+ symporter permease [Bacteroidota bacterium]